MPRYIVINENTLAYTQEGSLMVGVLAGSVLKGGANPLNGPIFISPSDKWRDATFEDFDTFRVFLTTRVKAEIVAGRDAHVPTTNDIPPSKTDGAIMKFDTEQEAFDWMYETVDDGCIDNTRLAYKDDDKAVALYEEAVEEGCCGSFDTEVIIAGRPAMIGCNFGH